MNPAARSITQFLTDGSLASLCDAASVLLGSSVQLIDEQGNHLLISRVDTDNSLSITQEAPGVRIAFDAPILVRRKSIGAIAIEEGAAWNSHPDEVRHWLGTLASIIGELCEYRISMDDFERELDILDSLTRHLITGRGLDAILRDGLRAAIELVGADGGTIRTLNNKSSELRLVASEGFSERYLEEAELLPSSEEVASAALAGEPVVIESIEQHPRLLRSEAIASEGFTSMLSSGLVFQDKPLGIVRVYTREQTRFRDADKASLSSISRQIATALAIDTLIEDRTNADRLRRQVRIASHIQQRMLPREIPSTPTLDIHAEFEPSLELAGDFYDVFPLGDRVAFVVGDVVGKGIPAALLMSSVRASLRAYARNELETNDIAHIVTRTNRALCRDSQPSEFATLVCGSFEPASSMLRLCSAGHEPSLLAHDDADSIRIESLDVGGIPIGIDPDAHYEAQDITLEPGDSLVLLSDGLPEAMSFEQEFFGRARVLDAIRVFLAQHPDTSARHLAQHLLWEMRRFTGLKQNSDDATILTMRVTG
ncbi:MAG: PP2C family protein-serine/threonine phosphatase [Phycisphaerales bacterium JB043]